MTEVIVKRVNDNPIYLENTTYDGMLSGILIFLLILSGLIFILYSMVTSTSVWTPSGYNVHLDDTSFALSLVCLVTGFSIWFFKIFGIFSKPAYKIYTPGYPSQVVPILEDGTDQARVCIAVKMFEREILEESKKDATLKKIAEGCR
jgi:hypothetical protein